MIKQLIPTLISGAILVASSQVSAFNSPHTPLIDLKHIETDMQFLASDKLKGRLAGSDEIILAENYIAEQFKQAGLIPLQGLSGYKQEFQLHQYKPDTIAVTLNNSNIKAEHVAFAGSQAEINWQQDDVNTIVVNKDDDLRKTLQSLNQQGGHSLVLVNPSHQALFARYQGHLANGSQSLTLRKPAALVMVLTEQTNIEQLNVSATIKHNTQTLANIIGILPGKEKADEFIAFSAHHDHIGTRNVTGDEDGIYNGANDDASGVSAVLNLARYFKHRNNTRSIMFISFTAEESGLLGSSHFIKDINSDAIKAMLNIEMIGKSSEFGPGRYWMTGYERSNLASILNANLSNLLPVENSEDSQPIIMPDPYEKYQLFYRSDNASLARLGVPAHSLSSTQISNDKDYHNVSDELSTLNLAQMRDIIDSIALASQSLIDGSDTPTRIEQVKARTPGLIF